MANVATYTTTTTTGTLYIQGKSSTPQYIATFYSAAGYTGAQRAQIVANRLNTMFGDPDNYWFEFCTPGMIAYGTYTVIIINGVSRNSSPNSTWYSTAKEGIMDVGPNDSTLPWYTALLWANRIRAEVDDDYGFDPTPLYAPSGNGSTDTTYVYNTQPDSYYGAGETLNTNTANGEIFHTCDLTVATNRRWTASQFTSTFYQNGSVWVRIWHGATSQWLVARQNDWGPSTSVYNNYCRTIDLSAGGVKAALGTSTGNCSSGDRVDFRFLI